MDSTKDDSSLAVSNEQLFSRLETAGFVLLQNVFTAERIAQILSEIESAFSEHESKTNLRTSRKTVFAARNLIDMLPNLGDYWNTPVTTDFLRTVLGDDFGLVRVLYFDKPSHRSWTLPWHKDMTLAVKNNRLGGNLFSKPTTKAGVPHVEGSESILRNMLTLRIHLDEITEDNGPLEVLPGSHATGKSIEPAIEPACKVLSNAGDVLAMRPLISHASGHSNPEKELRRRILHLEFCGERNLPDGYEWQWFIPPS